MVDSEAGDSCGVRFAGAEQDQFAGRRRVVSVSPGVTVHVLHRERAEL